MTIIEAIRTRKSCRTYSARAIEPEKLAELRQCLASTPKPPFGSAVLFHLIDFNEMETEELKKLTTYGIIKGARHFIVGTVEKQPKAMEDYGYCMERNILKTTSLGLGTCWLGGTFKRGGFADKIGITERKLLPAITPVGYSGDKRSFIDRTFRFVAGSDKRKPWHELFYRHDKDTPLDKEKSGNYETPLDCVRTAPSASNKQPWRIIKDKDRNAFHFYLKRTPGYGNIAKDIELQNVDMGIAMYHFEMSAKELDLNGDWSAADPPVKSDGMEYIVSWMAHDEA